MAVESDRAAHALGDVLASCRSTCVATTTEPLGAVRTVKSLRATPVGRLPIIDDVNGGIRSVTADAAYDTRPIYDAAEGKGAEVVVPPSRKASTSRRERRHGARDQTIRRVKVIGRRRWKKESGYHRQGRVENTFYRYKAVIGECLRARVRGAQESEAVLGCNVLNRMRALGWPTSAKIVP